MCINSNGPVPCITVPIFPSQGLRWDQDESLSSAALMMRAWALAFSLPAGLGVGSSSPCCQERPLVFTFCFYLLISHSKSFLTCFNATTELSSSCLISWDAGCPLPHQISDTLHHLVLSPSNNVPAHHWGENFHFITATSLETLWASPTTILTGSWTTGDSPSRLHLYTCFLRPFLVLNAPVEVSQGVGHTEMRHVGRNFHALPPDPGWLVKIIYINYCQIFIHVAQIH